QLDSGTIKRGAAAAGALRRAVALTPGGPDAARRTLLAAELSMAAGDLPECRLLAERALTGTPEPAVRVDLERIRATALGRMGELEAGIQPLLAHADRIAADDPGRAALLLLGAGPAFWFTGRFDRFGTVVARAEELAGEEHPVEAAMAGLLGAMVDVNVGRAADAEARIARHGHVLDRDDLPDPGYEVLASPAHVSVWTGRLDRADDLIERQLTIARRGGAAAALVYPLTVRGQLDLRRGRASSALAVGAEAVALGQDTRQTVLVGLAAAILAQTEAALGREPACREHVALAHRIADETGSVMTGLIADAALGALELCLGRLEPALAALDRCARTAARTGQTEPNVIRWQGDRIEVLARLGRTEEAAADLAVLVGHAEVAPTPWTTATVARGRALLASDADAVGEHETAIGILEAAGDRLEAARLRLALGERLRRGRQRRLAREPLRAALEVFERAGATPWAARTAVELRATGGALEPAGAVGAGGSGAVGAGAAVEELTPRELRVALLVAEGRTNPEVAAELFLSRKTVEHHLSQIYRKLGLRSRTELAREMAGAAG
ncbi:LuxR C-terminal-related transcriptional regulator, partial [Patulibacter sp. NPDC049589]|uniref:LuxR C-terminal-related transcriptional regulator n=1 Tax=Patulibacter sp. NPDC049589 TaxID=3154731 RepID=UPI003441F52E